MSYTNKSLITIGIPFYNDEKYLNKAILSVFNQTYTDWILVLLDDGSTDNSLSIAKQYSGDGRVRIMSDGLNRSLPVRLNELIESCGTKYLARMDSDDIMHPDRIRTQLEILEKNPDIDVLGTNAYILDKDDNITGVRHEISDVCRKVDTFIHPSIVAKTEWYKQNRYGEKAHKAQDTILWEQAKRKSDFRATGLPLLYYREVSGTHLKRYLGGLRTRYTFYRDEPDKGLKKRWLKQLLIHAGKTAIYYVFNLIRMESFLLKRRSLKLYKEQIVKGQNDLKIALADL
jgi:glycosyltransferase involved in cell wall biosynthesis